MLVEMPGFEPGSEKATRTNLLVRDILFSLKPCSVNNQTVAGLPIDGLFGAKVNLEHFLASPQLVYLL